MASKDEIYRTRITGGNLVSVKLTKTDLKKYNYQSIDELRKACQNDVNTLERKVDALKAQLDDHEARLTEARKLLEKYSTGGILKNPSKVSILKAAAEKLQRQLEELQ